MFGLVFTLDLAHTLFGEGFMEFSGRRFLWMCGAALILAVSLGFGSGLLVGRQFPARHFERFGNSSYLLDPSTGRICDPFKDPSGVAGKPPPGFVLEGTQSANASQNASKPAPDLSDLFGSKPSGPPSCKK